MGDEYLQLDDYDIEEIAKQYLKDRNNRQTKYYVFLYLEDFLTPYEEKVLPPLDEPPFLRFLNYVNSRNDWTRVEHKRASQLRGCTVVELQDVQFEIFNDYLRLHIRISKDGGASYKLRLTKSALSLIRTIVEAPEKLAALCKLVELRAAELKMNHEAGVEDGIPPFEMDEEDGE